MRQLAVSLITAAMVITGLNAQSVKLPDWNGAYGTTGPVSHFFQPTEGLTLLDGDGALFIMVEMPKGETKLQNGDYGFNRYLMGTDRRASSNNNFFLCWDPPRNRFRFAAKSAAGAISIAGDTLAMDGGMIDETAVLVIVERSGDIFSIRAVSGTDGTVYGTIVADTLAGFAIGAKTGDNGFAVGGTAASITDATFDRERGHNGNIEFVGYVTATVSDADAQAIALGADPVSTLSETNFRWYRHFAGAETETTLVPTLTNDTSRPTVVRGAEYMVGGANLRNQAPDTWFRMDYIPDGRVWGLNAYEPENKSVTLTGTHKGLSGFTTVQVRVLNAADMAVTLDWTDAVTVTDDSTWQATLTLAKSHGWDYVEARPAHDTSLVWRSRSRCGVGYKVAFIGQSETHYMLVGYGADMAYDGEALSFVSHGSDNPVQNFSGSIADVRTPQIYVAEPWDKLGDGLLAAARQLQRYTDAPLCIANHSISGSAAQALADDDNDARRWVDLLETVKLAGNDYSLMHWMWWVTANRGLPYEWEIFDPIILGDDDRITAGTYEHYMYDGTFQPGMMFATAGFWGFCFGSSYLSGSQSIMNYSNMNPTIEGQYNWRDHNLNERAGVDGFPGCSPAEFPVGWDVAGDRYHWGHTNKNSNQGPRRLGYRAGEFLARIFGYSDSKNPKLQNAWFGAAKDTVFARISLPNGGVLHTAGDTLVTGMWVSDDNGTTWQQDSLAARIVDDTAGIVRLVKDNGTWDDSLQVAFVVQRIWDGDSLGYLYEGPADGGAGTGVLAMENGLGIPVQPYVPVPHATAKVVVQGSDPGVPSGISTVPGIILPYTGAPAMYGMDGHPVNTATAGPGIYVTRTTAGMQKTILLR